MDMQVIIYVVIGLGVAIFVALLFMLENASDSLGNWLFNRLGWSSGDGPLLIVAERNGEKLTLMLKNHGQTRINLSAVEGRDCNNQRYFPKPCFQQRDIPSYFSRLIHELERTDLCSQSWTALGQRITRSVGKEKRLDGKGIRGLRHG